MKSREEVDKLKSDWLGDPCWDIEQTEGFSEYYEELFFFRRDAEHRWKYEREKNVRAFAERLGLESNKRLAEYLYTKFEVKND